MNDRNLRDAAGLALRVSRIVDAGLPAAVALGRIAALVDLHTDPEPAAPSTPPSLEFSGDTWHATGKLGRDLHTGASTIEYESHGPNWRAARLWATARGHVTEVDS